MRFDEFLAIDGVEEHCELGTSFGFMAFHGGNLERMTDEIASVAAQRSGASLYTVVQPYPMREHLPSSEVRPEHSAKLRAFFDHVDVVIALHGYGREGRWTELLVGGSNRELAAHLSDHLHSRLDSYVVLSDLELIPKDLRGLHPRNPVNLPKFGGVQLELPPRVRGLTPHAASQPRVDGRIPATNALIDALVETALTYVPHLRPLHESRHEAHDPV